MRKFDSSKIKDVHLRSTIISFLRSNIINSDKPVLLIVGSSLSWGYSWGEKGPYSYHLQNYLKDYKVINASIVGGGNLETYFSLLNSLKKLNVKVSKIIYESNILNFYSDNPKDEYVLYSRWKFIEFFDKKLYPYLSLYLTDLYGFGAYKIVIDEYNYPQGERIYAKNNLPDTYFDPLNNVSNEKYLETLFQLLTLSKDVSDEVYFFISPLLKEAIPQERNLEEKIYGTMNKMEINCNNLPGVYCINGGLSSQSKYFSDISHFNLEGHEEYSKIILNRLIPNAKQSQPDLDKI